MKYNFYAVLIFFKSLVFVSLTPFLGLISSYSKKKGSYEQTRNPLRFYRFIINSFLIPHFSLFYIVHLYSFVFDFAILFQVDTQQVFSRIRTVAFAHGIEGDVVNPSKVALIPSMNMSAEYGGHVPFLKLTE